MEFSTVRDRIEFFKQQKAKAKNMAAQHAWKIRKDPV